METMARRPRGPEYDPLYEDAYKRNLKVQDQIRANYRESPYTSVVQVNAEWDYDCPKNDPLELRFDVPVEDLTYEMICFASTKLVLEYNGWDRKQHAIELHSAHNHGENRKNAPSVALRLVPAPGTKISITLMCKTQAPRMHSCKLKVHALGIWHQNVAPWNELSLLEVDNRMFKRLLYSAENLLSNFNRYNALVNGTMIFEKEQRRVQLSHAEQEASLDLHAVVDLMRRVQSTGV